MWEGPILGLSVNELHKALIPHRYHSDFMPSSAAVGHSLASSSPLVRAFDGQRVPLRKDQEGMDSGATHQQPGLQQGQLVKHM